MSHTVTITKLPDETSDGIEYEFGGTHDAKCEFYRECSKGWHRHPNGEDRDSDEWSTKRAPQPHMYLDGRWCVPVDQNDQCALTFVFEGYGSDETLEGIGLGETRDVYCDWDGECWSLVVLEVPANKTIEGA
jgi:hypothetical protein